MDNRMKTFMKRLLLLYACALGTTVLMVREFSHGLFSPRGLGVILATLCIAIGTTTVLLAKNSAKEFVLQPSTLGTPIDTVDRKLLLRVARRAKIRIATTAVLLVLAMGLPEIRRDVPVWALLVALAVSLLIIVTSARTVIRLKTILHLAAGEKK